MRLQWASRFCFVFDPASRAARVWLFSVLCAGGLASVASGCLDPCVFFGGCNVHSDCDEGQVCRLSRTWEFGCGVLEGACVDVDADRACGSLADCASNECCDPSTNRCIHAGEFISDSCDALTCADCTRVRPPCDESTEICDPSCDGVRGCDEGSECDVGDVCRLTRSFEPASCTLFMGACITDDGRRQTRLCGSVADCAQSECCDPYTNRCVAADLYPGPACDVLTCPDCSATQVREICSHDTDCAPTEACVSGPTREPMVCARRCSDNSDCHDGEECNLDTCSYRTGTPCDDGAYADRSCGIMTCANVDEGGRTVDPYCAGSCGFLDEVCPDDFVCGDDYDCVQR